MKKNKVTLLLEQAEVLVEMTYPLGSVSAQEYAILLDVAKQLREYAEYGTLQESKCIRVRKRKTQEELEKI